MYAVYRDVNSGATASLISNSDLHHVGLALDIPYRLVRI